jgi:mono/diheme cytochrome c family protein
MATFMSDWRRMAGTAVVLLIASAPTSSAQDSGDPVAGGHFAETWCSTCHVVTATQKQGTSTGAPTFRAIAAQKAITPMALAAFLQTPHHRMPDLNLTREEIADISAYILSLRPPPKP